MSQFYALMSDNTVKHISLKEEIVTEIKNIFINGGAIFKPEGKLVIFVLSLHI